MFLSASFMTCSILTDLLSYIKSKNSNFSAFHFVLSLLLDAVFLDFRDSLIIVELKALIYRTICMICMKSSMIFHFFCDIVQNLFSSDVFDALKDFVVDWFIFEVDVFCLIQIWIENLIDTIFFKKQNRSIRNAWSNRLFNEYWSDVSSDNVINSIEPFEKTLIIFLIVWSLKIEYCIDFL